MPGAIRRHRDYGHSASESLPSARGPARFSVGADDRFEPVDERAFQKTVDAEIDELLAAYHQRQDSLMIVSNEVGLGLVPPYALGRYYRDALGRANQRLAQAADQVVFMVAGLPMKVKG